MLPVWANFAASYEAIKGVHLGVNGYYLKQLTLDRFFLTDNTYYEGKKPAEGKQQVLGIGPGAYWEVAKTDKLYANYYYQLLVEARPVRLPAHPASPWVRRRRPRRGSSARG